jgi:hypothetical protein
MKDVEQQSNSQLLILQKIKIKILFYVRSHSSSLIFPFRVPLSLQVFLTQSGKLDNQY